MMIINENNIKFTFYMNSNKYVVFSPNTNVSFGDDLYFAKEIAGANLYESVSNEEYPKVLDEYMSYLNSISEGDLDEN